MRVTVAVTVGSSEKNGNVSRTSSPTSTAATTWTPRCSGKPAVWAWAKKRPAVKRRRGSNKPASPSFASWTKSPRKSAPPRHKSRRVVSRSRSPSGPSDRRPTLMSETSAGFKTRKACRSKPCSRSRHSSRLNWLTCKPSSITTSHSISCSTRWVIAHDRFRLSYSKIMSSTVWPPGIIGKTCSWYGTSTSSRNGPSYRIISRIAVSRSACLRTVAAPQP